MSYQLIYLDIFDGQIGLYKLENNGNCQFDEFCQKIERNGNLVEELDTIFARLEDICNNNLLPHTKFKDITPKNDINKEYEIKTKNLRVYLTKQKGVGKIIIWGGLKNSQKKDIVKFRKAKKDYFRSIKQNEK